MKSAIIGLVILAYVIPFAYMFIAILVDVAKQIYRLVNLRLKPALIVVTRSFLD